MTKKDFTKIQSIIKRQPTTVLTEKASKLSDIIDDRELTRKMYFWIPSGKPSHGTYYDRDYNIKIVKDLTICYKRNFSQSWKHTYASDKLWGISANGEIKVSIADVKKIINIINDILSSRK